MKKRVFLKAVVLSALLALPFAAEAAEHGHNEAASAGHADQAGHGPGALVEEMKALDAVFRDVVSAVALGEAHRVHQALESMHGRMEKTQEALHKGDVVLRKNASKAAEFERMDKEFHARLESLGRAAHKGDRKGMTAITKKLLDGCVSCHEKFRP